MNGRLRFQLYLLLLVIFTVVLAVLSLQSFSSPRLVANQDKVGHFIAYLFTAWLACQVLALRLKSLASVLTGFVYAAVIGAVLELLQAYYTTSRQGEWSDVLANLLGALAGCVIFCLVKRVKFSHECNETD